MRPFQVSKRPRSWSILSAIRLCWSLICRQSVTSHLAEKGAGSARSDFTHGGSLSNCTR